MKRDKPSSEFKTFIKDFESHDVDIFAHLSQQQIEKYLELCQRHTFLEFDFYRHLVMPLDNYESEELKRFYDKLFSIELKYTEKDGDISNLFKLFWGWKPSSFTYSRSWYGGGKVMFKSTPNFLPDPWPKNTEMMAPSNLHPIKEDAAYGYRLSERFPLLSELPDGRKLPIMHPAEFARRKLASTFLLWQPGGKIGPSSGWEGDILDVVSLLDARGAFIPARITEARFADILAKSEPMGGGNLKK